MDADKVINGRCFCESVHKCRKLVHCLRAQRDEEIARGVGVGTPNAAPAPLNTAGMRTAGVQGLEDDDEVAEGCELLQRSNGWT